MTTHPVSQSDSPATADRYDKHGESLQSCDLQLRHHGQCRPSAVPSLPSNASRTTRCSSQSWARTARGVSWSSTAVSLNTALMGDMIAKIAVSNKWAGVIINGAVRDTAILAELPIGLKALGLQPPQERKDRRGRT